MHEISGTAAWFVAKEYVTWKLVERWVWRGPSYSIGVTNTMNTELLAWELAVLGAIAGAVSVLMFYPVDMVKSMIQTEEELRLHGVGRNSGRSSFVGMF